MSPTGETIVVAGSLAQRPGVGGHAWVFLQYLLGFRRLGWEVLFLDRLDSSMGAGDAGRRYLVDVMAEFGLPGDFALLGEEGESVAGLSRAEVAERVRRSAVLLNVMGFLADEGLLAAAPKRVFLDIDPGFGQMWRELGLADVFAGHDTYVTVGENVGGPGCAIPTCGLEWIPTRQPVVLERWPVAERNGEAFTSVGSWRGPYAPVEYGGQTYGLRVHEFRKFAELPRRTRERFEVALDIDTAEGADLELLAANGWALADPRMVAPDPDAYQRYIHTSKAEFTVAKGIYVLTKSGWFSDRSICYLASGKPVLAQDTGIRDLYPTGHGLLVFSALDEAVAGVEEIGARYDGHARAARELAEEYFDSDKVLSGLLEKLDVG
jgi:hypothetical protein